MFEKLVINTSYHGITNFLNGEVTEEQLIDASPVETLLGQIRAMVLEDLSLSTNVSLSKLKECCEKIISSQVAPSSVAKVAMVTCAESSPLCPPGVASTTDHTQANTSTTTIKTVA